MKNNFYEVERSKILDLSISSLYSNEQDCVECLSYLKEKRKISDKIIKLFNIGYCPLSSGHSLAGRLIMPIYDYSNNLVALTTRDFRDNAKMKHWHESFEKSYYLYGLSISKESILKYNKCVLVEGQFDVMTLHSYGIPFVIAPLGGTLSFFQISLISRLCKNIYLCFDNDNSGISAKERAYKIYEEKKIYNFGIKFIDCTLDSKEDPDEFVIKNGPNSFIEYMKKKSNPLIEV